MAVWLARTAAAAQGLDPRRTTAARSRATLRLAATDWTDALSNGHARWPRMVRAGQNAAEAKHHAKLQLSAKRRTAADDLVANLGIEGDQTIMKTRLGCKG